MHHPLATPRPRPPSRAPSRLPTEPVPTLEPAAQSLRPRLSSTSLSQSIPPDSPPAEELPGSSLTELPVSPTRLRRLNSRAVEAGAPVPFPSSPVPFPSSPVIEPDAPMTSNSMRAAVLEYAGRPQAEQPIPVLSKEWLLGKTRADLEALLAGADHEIRKRQQDLELAAQVGKSLLDENIALRSRQESLFSGQPTPLRSESSFTRPSELRDRPSPSPRTWKPSMGFPPAFISPTRPKAGTDRHRVPSSASSTSLFTSEISHALSPAPHRQELQSLNQANYSLTVQLSDLQSDAEQAERDGQRKLRKMEKELGALRGELKRIELRNDVLEGDREAKEVASLSESWGSSRQRTTSGSSEGVTSTDDDAGTPIAPTFPVASMDSSQPPSVVPSPSSRESPLPAERSLYTPTKQFYRAPGTGYTAPRLSQSILVPASPSVASQTAEDDLDDLIEELMAKNEELQQTNELLIEATEELQEKYESIERENEDLRLTCGEMEDELALNGVEWKARKGEIGWHASEDSPAPRLKGNRRMIEHRRREEPPMLTMSNSDHSLSSIGSQGEAWEPQRSVKRRGSRTLDSELGTAWAAYDSEGDEGEDEHSSVSTSMPFGRQLRREGPDVDYLGSSFDLSQIGSVFAGGAHEAGDESLATTVEDERHARRRKGKGKGKGTARRARESLGQHDGLDRAGYTPSSALSRRAQALRRFGLPDDNGSVARYGDSYQRSQLEDDEESTTSSFEYLRSRDYAGREGTDYYPSGLIARYHPRMIVIRMQDAAARQAALTLTYVRFFVLLALAIVWALWQGPKKTLALLENKPARRSRA